MTDCIFCKVINKELPSQPVFEDGNFLVIPDRSPKAPTHYLLMPKKHIEGVSFADSSDRELLGQLLLLAGEVAKSNNIHDYKLIQNNGRYAEIPHLHFHLVSGEMTGKI